jgi:UDP-N-acetylmuramate dehydrogenase
VARGHSLGTAASVSTKHTLALTNRGGASAADVLALAADVRDRVRDAFGIELEPEPTLVGCALPPS